MLELLLSGSMQLMQRRIEARVVGNAQLARVAPCSLGDSEKTERRAAISRAKKEKHSSESLHFRIPIQRNVYELDCMKGSVTCIVSCLPPILFTVLLASLM